MNQKLIQAIKLANTLRQAAAVEELFYSPSLRETIAFGKLLEKECPPKECSKLFLEMCICNGEI